jgi:pimeloyl-ACP methyl ester carboxylesterase
MTPEELQAALPRHNPVLRLAPLAAAKVPILHLHGDHDSVVPLDLHSGELVRRYRELGGSIELVVIPGAEHEEIPAFFESPRVPEFLIGGK